MRKELLAAWGRLYSMHTNVWYRTDASAIGYSENALIWLWRRQPWALPIPETASFCLITDQLLDLVRLGTPSHVRQQDQSLTGQFGEPDIGLDLRFSLASQCVIGIEGRGLCDIYHQLTREDAESNGFEMPSNIHASLRQMASGQKPPAGGVWIDEAVAEGAKSLAADIDVGIEAMREEQPRAATRTFWMASAP